MHFVFIETRTVPTCFLLSNRKKNPTKTNISLYSMFKTQATALDNVFLKCKYRMSQKYRLSLKVRHLEVLWSTEK
jgi:hypothetical protein